MAVLPRSKAIWRWLAVGIWSVFSLGALAAAADPAPLEIVRDTVLDPGKTYGPIVIKASGVTVDGRGAWVVGATGDPKRFQHAGVSARNASRITLRNLNVKGFETD